MALAVLTIFWTNLSKQVCLEIPEKEVFISSPVFLPCLHIVQLDPIDRKELVSAPPGD